MNARIIRFLFGTTVAGAIALLLLVLPIPTPAHAGGSVTTCDEAGLDAALAGGGSVTFNCGGTNNPATITLASQKTITASTTIDGGSIITLSGGMSTSLLLVNSGVTLTLNSITLTDGHSSDYGGCVFVIGTLSLNNVTMTKCVAAGATSRGGALYLSLPGRATLNNSTVFSNTSDQDGGGVYNLGALTVSNSIVISNTASGCCGVNGGGGIFNDSILIVNSSTISGNVANLGGGILNTGVLTISNGTINGNDAFNRGGGIFNDFDSTLIMNNTTISHNDASYGGGIYNYAGMTITMATLSGNSAADGGAIFNYANATLTSVTVSGNTSNNGGGITNNGHLTLNTAALNLNNSTISGNSVTGVTKDGGGIYHQNGTLTVTNSTISGNSATGNGGGIFNADPTTLINVSLSGNTAAYGGAIYIGDVMTMTNATLSGNNASNGGGIYQSAGVADPVKLSNTIIAKGSVGGNCDAPGTPITSNGYNLSDDGTCVAFFNQTGDLNNTSPKLGSLSNNGGPTLTHALLPGSPAIDTIPFGTNGCGTTLTTDQRGAHRPIGAHCDVGAYEAGYLFLPLILK